MALVDVARPYYATQAALSDRAVRDARALWAELDPAAPFASWTASRLALRLFVMLATAQLAAASMAVAYLVAALTAQGARSAPRGVLVPRSLAGVASDGRDLESLLYGPLIRTTTALRDGLAPDRAMRLGESSLATIVATQTADAGRDAVSVAMAVEPAVTGWVRMLVPPSCGRCAILAGRRYRFSDGFRRHERCDCTMIPAVEDAADDLRTDPAAYFASLSREDQDIYFGKANTEAILDGADMNRVVNAGRSTSVAGSRRGRSRVTPHQIFSAAASREEAVTGLRRNGFIL